jgi:hypothetical protein
MSLKTPTLLCVVALGAAWSAMAAAAGNVVGAPEPLARKLPYHAIANGHNQQPRVDQLKSLRISDLTPEESKEVDRLYQQLEKFSGTPLSSSLSQAAVGYRASRARDGRGERAMTPKAENYLHQGVDSMLKICRGC